jgi:DNA (cytosine-5)-methyltransferase 1
MNELSLFSGSGGGLLGTKLLGFRHVGYVEWNEHCQRVIRQRIKDGLLDEAPIFSDIETFIRDGYARAYSGVVDVLSAGFPCQPFTQGGFGLAEKDERNKWPETLECVRIVRPWGVLLENSANLLNHEYIRHVFWGLAEIGYSARWDVLSACMFGAPQTRERLFIVAHPNGEYGQEWLGDVANQREVSERDHGEMFANWVGSISGNAGGGAGMADRVERTKAIGNGQVPRVVASAWRMLSADK